MLRLRQYFHDLGQRLLAVPLAFVMAAILLAQFMVAVDRSLSDERIPSTLTTTVDAGRAMLTAIAGGLISSVTLLLSLILVAVQLAASQFSPRTLQDWTGDRTQQVTIGLVLGTSVYCLLILRETRALGEGEVLVPHMSVLLAVVLGVVSLTAVVRSVDHLTRSLRVGSVARSITEQTVSLVRRRGDRLTLEHPALKPAIRTAAIDRDEDVPLDALVVTSEDGGWIQRIDEDELFEAIPDGSIARMAAGLGTHVLPGAPLAWIWPPPPDDRCVSAIRATIGLGQERTMQEDVGYGILQLVDVAIRALSPGINDPNTANDIIVNLGVVLLAIWEYPEEPIVRSEEGRTLVRRHLAHRDFLNATFGPLRRYGIGDASVVETMLRTLVTVRNEVQRRGLAGPVAPLDETIDGLLDAFGRTDPDEVDAASVRALVEAGPTPD